MKRKKFKLSHSVFALLSLLVIQSLAIHFLPYYIGEWLIIIFAIVGASITIYVATEVIEEVRNAPHMFVLLSAVSAEFVGFFACEYWHLLFLSPTSFPTLPGDIVSLLLHSMMVFVFNPLYLPGDTLGRALLFINTMSALGLVLFILQNVTQLQKLKPATRTRKTKKTS